MVLARSIVGPCCLSVALLACGDGGGSQAAEHDDTAERAALLEDRGFSFVGFVPVNERGTDGLVTIRPRALAVEGGLVGAILEWTRQTQQDPITNARAGFLSNGFVEGPSVSVFAPNVSSTTSIGDVHTGYWFVGRAARAYYQAMFTTTYGPMPYLSLRAAGGAQEAVALDPTVERIGPTPDTHGIAYAFRSRETIGVIQPTAAGGQSKASLTTSFTGSRVALGVRDGEVRVAATENRPAGAFLALYRRSGDTLELMGDSPIALAAENAPLRVLHAKETYVARQTSSELLVYQLRSGALAPITLPVGSKHTLGIDDEGALYVGFADPAAEGRASVQKLAGGGFASVGRRGFSRDPVTAHVFPVGSDLYVMFTSVKSAVGAVIACAGPSCAPYRKPVPATPVGGLASCSHGGDMCREAKGTTPKGFRELESWCAAQAGQYRASACPREGAVGACRKTYDGVEELLWSYGLYGKTAAMVEAACKATGTEFVPAG